MVIPANSELTKAFAATSKSVNKSVVIKDALDKYVQKQKAFGGPIVKLQTEKNSPRWKNKTTQPFNKLPSDVFKHGPFSHRKQ